MYQQAAAVDVPQEVVAKARTLGCTLDNARNIRHYEGNAVVHIDHAEIRIERREVIVRNFRVRVRGDGQERRFADIREADQTDVRQKLQLENDLMLLAREACLCKARNLAGRCAKC